MNKKGFTLLFILVSTIANVLLTLLCIALLAVTFIGVLKAFHIEAGSSAYGTALVVSFLEGLIISFFLYTKVSTLIIKKFNMTEKFEDKWLDHSRSRSENGSSSKEKPRQTKMPSSVLPTDEEKEEKEKWGE